MLFFLRNMRNLILVMAPVMLAVFVYSHYFQKPKDELAFIGAGDPQMAAARAEGRATLPDFLEHLTNPAPDESHFAVKFRLDQSQVFGGLRQTAFAPPGDEPDEYIWGRLPTLSPDRTTVTALLDDEPRAKGFFKGQPMVVPVGDIVDWGYSKGGVMQGNFTTKVLLTKLSPREAAQAKQVMGWR